MGWARVGGKLCWREGVGGGRVRWSRAGAVVGMVVVAAVVLVVVVVMVYGDGGEVVGWMWVVEERVA